MKVSPVYKLCGGMFTSFLNTYCTVMILLFSKHLFYCYYFIMIIGDQKDFKKVKKSRLNKGVKVKKEAPTSPVASLSSKRSACKYCIFLCMIFIFILNTDLFFCSLTVNNQSSSDDSEDSSADEDIKPIIKSGKRMTEEDWTESVIDMVGKLK